MSLQIQYRYMTKRNTQTAGVHICLGTATVQFPPSPPPSPPGGGGGGNGNGGGINKCWWWGRLREEGGTGRRKIS